MHQRCAAAIFYRVHCCVDTPNINNVCPITLITTEARGVCATEEQCDHVLWHDNGHGLTVGTCELRVCLVRSHDLRLCFVSV